MEVRHQVKTIDSERLRTISDITVVNQHGKLSPSHNMFCASCRLVRISNDLPVHRAEWLGERIDHQCDALAISLNGQARSPRTPKLKDSE
jgi:hypothetical protein